MFGSPDYISSARWCRLALPFALAALCGCNPSSLVGPAPEVETVIKMTNTPETVTHVVKIADTLPKSPRFSPFYVNHDTLSPFTSPTPDATPSPAPTPKVSPSPSPSLSPLP